MKKIIKSKLYNTETAVCVGAWGNGVPPGDLDFLSESLYRKKTGEYFLHGAGGARTCYACAVGENNWAGGEEIRPLSYEAAREWAEQRLDADAYQAAFGAVPDDDRSRVMTCTVSVGAYEAAKRAASKAGIGLGAYIERLIMEAANAQG